jgi:excisionase family DNA binding protein
METLWSTEEVAAYLSIPAKTIANWRAAGLGPRYSKIGRHVRYARSEVERWALETRAVAAGR